MGDTLTLAEVAALLAVAQDHALGQPPGSQLRAAVLGQRLAAATDLTEHDRATTWWTSTLRFLGCTGHAFDMAVVFGDEIEMRARASRYDFSSPFDVLRVMVASAGRDKTGAGRLRSVLSVLAGGKKAAELNFRTACEVADVFAKRLGVDDAVVDALTASFERWNGRGLPNGLRADAIPMPMRIAQLGQEFEILSRIEGVADALDIVRSRRSKAYAPDLTDLVLSSGAEWWEDVDSVDPWDAALALAPMCLPLEPPAVREALLVLADFADLKSPWTGDHSRSVARIVDEACGAKAELAALVHDIGRVSVPNTIWDKTGSLTRDERERAETHTLVTDQLLRRVPFLRELAATACSAHERIDGTGYHRRATGLQLDEAQRTLAAADCYQAMTSDRPHRVALARDEAAKELRGMAAAGELDGDVVERVLSLTGHEPKARRALAAGLTSREADVLRLLAIGLTTKEIADRLVISAKTADHHVQHIYRKIGVSTRGAAALFALEHGITQPGART